MKPRDRWTRRDSAHASAEGWDLFDVDGTGLLEIERVDEHERFTWDDEAVDYVRRRAMGRRPLHRKALRIHRHFQRAVARYLRRPYDK